MFLLYKVHETSTIKAQLKLYVTICYVLT